MCKKILILILLAIFINSSCSSFLDLGECENTSEKEAISPDRKYKAVIFDRGCGATVGFITGISILPADAEIKNNDTGNILFADHIYKDFEYKDNKIIYGKTNFAVEWINPAELKVVYSKSKTINKNKSFKDIKITFELMK